MMPLKEVKEPGSKSEPKKKPASKKPSGGEASAPESPWKINPDGSKERQGRRLPFEKEIHQFFIEVSGAVALADSFTANAIELKSEELAYGYARLAKDDPRVKAFFDKLLTGTAWSAALMPTVTLVAMVGFHYGLVPPRIGVPVVMMHGMMPLTREEEQALKAQHHAEQAAAQAKGSSEAHPHGESNGASDAS